MTWLVAVKSSSLGEIILCNNRFLRPQNIGMRTEISGHIFDIKKYAIHDGPGIRTTVFLKGCPMNCWWCHNPEGQNVETETGKEFDRKIAIDEVLAEIEQDRVFYEQSGGGATFSGGEPLMQVDFLQGLLRACKESGIHTAVDTCGYAEFKDFEAIHGLVDLFMYDLKIMNAKVHEEHTGKPNELIHDNLRKLSKKGENIRIRVPLIPAVTSEEENLLEIAEFVSSLRQIRRVDLLPYNQFGEGKYVKLGWSRTMRKLSPHTEEELRKKGKLFESFGFEVCM